VSPTDDFTIQITDGDASDGTAEVKVTPNAAAGAAARNATLSITASDGVNTSAATDVALTQNQVGALTLKYFLDPAKGSNNSYAGNCDITIDGITWNLTGNSTMIPWRLGGNSITGVDRALFSKTAISSDISQIVITNGTTNLTVNSMKVYVCSTAAGAAASTPTDVVASFTPTFVASSDVTIDKADATSWANCYYRIVYNVTNNSTSNKYVQFVGAKFY
jgi:hypothetical protein